MKPASAPRIPDATAWERCSVCHEAIPSEQMLEHPEVSVCLECLSSEERQALEHDLNSAARVQRALLPPRHLEFGGWSIQYLWEPFGTVSGDHVDVLLPPQGEDPLHLLVGDVAGKGVAASLLQAQLHALFRALAPVEDRVSGLLTRTNRLFHQATTDTCFATLVAMRLYPDGRIEFSNAGHPRPLLADRRGVRPVEGASLPLGIVPDEAYGERALQLRDGETLLLYTDGWTEAEHDGEQYGVGRAAATLRRARGSSANDLLSACRQDLNEFVNGANRGDDLTIVVVRRG